MSAASNDKGQGALVMRLMRKVYGFFASSKLALALLVTILLCCIIGVTVFRGEQAWRLIFTTTWFNALLVLLVVNVTFSFIGRTWGRKLTLVSLGMLLFHLTFLAVFLGVIYNSMFYFHGKLRLSEGETLPNGDFMSYDAIDHGRFFDKSKLKGQTTLVQLHWNYIVDGDDKVFAYEVAVGEGGLIEPEIIYITKHLNYNGFKYYRDKEAPSMLVTLHDASGRYIYGGVIPLQSLWMQDKKEYLYTTGTRYAPGTLPFPYPPATPEFDLQVTYHPSKNNRRIGEATFKVWPFKERKEQQELQEQKVRKGTIKQNTQSIIAEGRVALGEMFPVKGLYLSLREVRYWVGMDVRYDPGYPIILSSLWVGLAGVVLVFIGRLRMFRARQRTLKEQG